MRSTTCAEAGAVPRQALLLTCGHVETAGAALSRHATPDRAILALDQYALDAAPLEGCAGLLIGMHSDQRFLAAHAGRLERYLRQGGSMVVNGHVAYPFLPGASSFQPVPGGHPRDLEVHRERAHPIWAGVSAHDLTFRRGVAGFYGRGWHRPPEGALVIHSLGQERWPLDIIWRVGAGRVLLHGGNDLWQFGDGIAPRLLAWLFDESGAL